MTKPTFLRVGVPKNKVRPPTKILPPTSSGAAPTLDPQGWIVQTGAGTGTFDVSYETGVAGDIIIMLIWTNSNVHPSTPAGWTQVGIATSAPDDGTVWAKVADGTESGTETVSLDNNSMVTATNRIKGGGQTLTLNTEFNAAISSDNPPAVTLADSSSYFVIATAYREQGGTLTDISDPTGYDEVAEVSHNGMHIGIAQKNVSGSGVEDPSTFSFSITSPGVLSRSFAYTTSFGVSGADPTVAAYSHTHVEADVTDLDHWVEADHDALDHTGLTGVGASDHGGLSGLTDDDHTQYIKADGTRAFTGTVSGVTPTASAHLVTKGYVDSLGVGVGELLVPDVVENPIARYTATAAKTIANTVTETTMFGTGVGTLTFPANFLGAGEVTEIRMRGQLSDTGTPNFTIKLKLGSTVLCSVGPTALTGVSNVEWMLDLMLTCRSAGASGVFIAGGLFDYDDGTEVSLSSASTVNIDTTAAQTLDVTWEWGTADPADTITVQEAYVDSHDPNRVVNDALGPLTNEDETDFLYEDSAAVAAASSSEFHGALVYHTGSTQNVPDATYTAISFSTEDYDNGGYWDSGNPTRFTVPTDGIYELVGSTRMDGQATFDTGAGQFVSLRFRRNGGTTGVDFWGEDFRRAIQANDPGHSVAAVAKLDAGDYVELVIFQNSGETLTVPGDNTLYSRMSIQRLKEL